MKSCTYLFIAFTLFLTGCQSQYTAYPLAVKPEYGEQQKVQAAAHWKTIAYNEAALMLKKLASQPGSVYIDGSSGGDSAFANAYSELLTSALVQNGTAVQLSSSSATHTLYYDIQAVRHRGRGLPPIKPGVLTALATAVFLIDSSDNWGDQNLLVVPLVAAAEYLLYKNKFTNTPVTEVIITTKLKRGDSLVSSNSSIYYFNVKDSSHYKDSSQNKTFKVVGVSE